MPKPLRPDTLIVASLLATTGGLLDAVVYLNHGHVFANAMTGNVILLGTSALSHDPLQAARHLVPVAAFLAGVAMSRFLRVLPQQAAAFCVLSVEMVVLLLAGLLPASFPDMCFTALIAFVSAFQVSTFRTVGRFSYNSTFISGNLREVAEGIANSFVEDDPDQGRKGLAKSRKLGTVCGCFLGGAMLGAWGAPRFANHTLWLTEPLLLIVLLSIMRFGKSDDPATTA